MIELQRISSAELAGLLGISQVELGKHAQRGVLVKLGRNRYDLAGSVRAYCGHLREVAAGRGGAEAVAKLSAERARLAKEQADQYALRNARLRGEMVEAKVVEAEWSDVLRRVRSAMLAVPSRVWHRLPHLTRSDADEIDSEIRSALIELSETA